MGEKTSRNTTSSLDFLLNKHILIDTCFLIKSYENAPFFKGLFSIFKNLNCVPVIHQLIEAEFVRGSKTNQFYQTKKQHLAIFDGFMLPVAKEIIDNSIAISMIYANKGYLNTQISIVDCVNAGILQKYLNNLFLITLDIQDYPLILFDRLKIIPIDAGRDVFTCGIYKFNNIKFNQCLIDFKKI